ncbi:MAG TPA: hypothetical protein VLG37_04800 [Candidatus Saccharimonadales bacterium]|nr:hypothetical protein [Candidatus Saccharimonadales bacterium]
MPESQTQIALPSHETTPLHEPLSDEQLGNLLAAVGNHEGKAMTFLLMESHTSYGQAALRRCFIEAQGGEPVFEGAVTLHIRYCKQSFEQADLVTRTNDTGPLEFEKTSMGEQVGDAVVGLLLDFSLRWPDVSLREIFGSTQSTGGVRSAATRLKLYRVLANASTGMTKAELSRQAGVDETSLTLPLDYLSAAGHIAYEAVDNKRAPVFIIASSNLTTLGTRWPVDGSFPATLLELVKLKQARGENYLTTDEVREHFKSLGMVGVNDFNAQVHFSLKQLVKKGILKREVAPVPVKDFSHLKVGPAQRGMFREIVEILEGLQTLDSSVLERGRQLAANIKNDPEAVKALLLKCYSNSRYVNPVAKQDIQSSLAALFERLPKQEFSAEDLSGLMEKNGYIIHPSALMRQLKKLTKGSEAQLRAAKRKGVYIFSKLD